MRLKRKHLLVEIGSTIVIALLVMILFGSTNSLAFASFPEIGQASVKFWTAGGLMTDVLPSLMRFALGFVVAVVAGTLLGVAIGLSPLVSMVTQPLVSFFRSIPPVALLPFAIVALGVGDEMKIFLIAFVCLWPMVLNVSDGVLELDRTMLDSARSYRIVGVTFWRYIIAPAIMPRIFAGMRICLSIAILMLVTSEMIASTSGIGYYIFQAQQTYKVSAMWSGIFLLGVLGVLLNMIFVMVEKRALFWYLGARNSMENN